MASSLVRVCTVVSTLLVLFAGAALAQDGPIVSAQIDGAVLLAEYSRETKRWEADPGVEATLVLGWELPVGPGSLTPEIVAGWSRFGDPYGRDLLRVATGMRLRVRATVQPFLFAHLGWGTSEGIDGDAVLHRDGPLIEAGAGLELALDARWSLAAQIAWGALFAETGSGTDVAHWPNAGLAVAARF